MENRLEIDTKERSKKNKINQPQNKNIPPSDKLNKKEIGGRGGLDPARYGDWEKNGRCIDF
ncbi:MAG: DUF1674 domain-containing protein [Candidatus Marinimicrobia bacterium]|jgi:hypothetical protein|nr:DUF1674 domain-containing protein [Candidatus Neomarinimicrobiota bacterium]MDA9109000.1 DUF1674 domain-containing protein [Woeseiaceae bacterium]MDB2543698.1 DUF1674 domain-containing protein [Woeseiaceae bacterium]